MSSIKCSFVYTVVIFQLVDAKSWVQWMVVERCLFQVGGVDSIPIEFIEVSMTYKWFGVPKWTIAYKKVAAINQPKAKIRTSLNYDIFFKTIIFLNPIYKVKTWRKVNQTYKQVNVRYDIIKYINTIYNLQLQ